MKKVLLSIVALLLVVFIANAQSPIGKGEKQLNAGFGFSGWGLPLYVGGDMGIHEDITVGFEFSFRSYRESFSNVGYNSTILGISGNGNYHFNRILEIPDRFDFYAGLNFGFYLWMSPADYPGTGASLPGFGAQVGGRYYLNNRLSLNLEFGGGSTTNGGKFGITYKF